MDTVAIVILNWNGKEHLEKFLPSVVQHSSEEGCKIYVADNGSTDGSVSFLEQNYPNIRQIVLHKNNGYATGYNLALQKIDAKYYVLLNSDVEVTENWLKPVISYLEENPDVASAMPKIKSYNAPHAFEYAGAAGGFIDRFGYPFCRGRVLSDIEMDEGQYNTVAEIFWASGACMFVRSDMFFKAGGFDDYFFAHMEEIDLCWRMKRLGAKIVCVPMSEVFHVGGGTLPINTPFKLFLNYRNNLFLLQKNLSSLALIPVILVRLVLDGMSACVFLARGDFGFFGAVFKAHLNFYGRLFKTHKERRKFKKIALIQKVGQVYPKSMVFDFFFKKKRKFHHFFPN